jgi:hypothetical protein
MHRRAVATVGFATGLVAGTAVYRRLFGSKRERLDIYFDDGSFVTVGDGSPDAERLLPLAHLVLAAVRRP